jgi:hypothetical protein
MMTVPQINQLTSNGLVVSNAKEMIPKMTSAEAGHASNFVWKTSMLLVISLFMTGESTPNY